MGFFDFWNSEGSEAEQPESQLSLTGESEKLAPQRKRADGVSVFRRFTQSIQDNGGDQDAHSDAIQAETYAMFDCSVKQLYEGTGAKRGKRETLPHEAQQAYMVNESLSAYELERSIGTIGGESQDEVNDKITAVVRETAKTTRKWLPW